MHLLNTVYDIGKQFVASTTPFLNNRIKIICENFHTVRTNDMHVDKDRLRGRLAVAHSTRYHMA